MAESIPLGGSPITELTTALLIDTWVAFGLSLLQMMPRYVTFVHEWE